jgi:hypothetical protein
MNKHKAPDIINYLARDTAKALRLNMDNGDVIRHRGHIRHAHRLLDRVSATFYATYEAATQGLVRIDPDKMSVYYSALAQGVSDLPNNTYEARQALYDRSEVALAAELQQTVGLSDAEITHERLALHRAIRKIERDARTRPVVWPHVRLRRETVV